MGKINIGSLMSLESEELVIGAVFLDSGVLDEIGDSIRSEDFGNMKLGIIFESMVSLCESSAPVDTVSVSGALKTSGHLAAIGGLAYLAELAEKAVTTVGIEHHAKTIRSYSIRRKLVQASAKIAHKAADETEDELDVLALADKSLQEIGEYETDTPLITADRAIMEMVEQVQQARESDSNVTGLSTGLLEVDNMTAGLQNGDMIVLAARPSMGKSALALDIARHNILSGIGVLFFSVEMPASQLMGRMTAAHASLDILHDIRLGKMSDADSSKFALATNKLGAAPIVIDHSAVIRPSQIRVRSRRVKGQMSRKGIRLGLIVVDYIQLLGTDRVTPIREQEVADTSRQLKALARELDLPVLALSQLNRGVENRGKEKRPVLSDLRESGAIEQDSDVVMMLFREEQYGRTSDNEGLGEVLIQKQRNGPTGIIPLHFNKRSATWRNLSYRDET